MTVIRRSQRNTGGQFAKGKKAVAVCQRSGMKYLQKDMIFEPGTGYFVHKSESDGAHNIVTDKLNYPAPILRTPETIGLKYSSPEVDLAFTSVTPNLDVYAGVSVNNMYLDYSALYPTIREDGIHFNFLTNTYWAQASGTAAALSSFSSLITYTTDTNSYYRDASGLLVHPATTSTPRVEYDLAGNRLGVLLEGQRTNIALQSSNLSGYVLTGVTIGADVIASPTGAVDADSLIESGATSAHFVQGTNVGAANIEITFSAFVKAGTRTKGRLRVAAASGSTICVFDLVAKTATPSATSGNGTCTNGSITEYANGWFRITATGVPDSTSGLTYAPVVDMADAAGAFSYTGTNATVGMYVWGLQCEVAGSASSYIPTTTAAATRLTDHMFYLMGPEWKEGPGTIRATVQIPNNPLAFPRPAVDINFNTVGYARRHQLTAYVGSGSGNSQYAVVADDLSVPVPGLQVAANVLTKNVAAAWAVNDFGHAANGTASVLDQGGVLPTGLVKISFGEDDGSGGVGLYGWFQKFDYWPGRATTDELRAMTRL